jgi:hypothetical protein
MLPPDTRRSRLPNSRHWSADTPPYRMPTSAEAAAEVVVEAAVKATEEEVVEVAEEEVVVAPGCRRAAVPGWYPDGRRHRRSPEEQERSRSLTRARRFACYEVSHLPPGKEPLAPPGADPKLLST